MLWSMQDPHPSPQSLRAPASFSGLACSIHPGQAHKTPHEHPEPANDDISLMEGIEGKSGTADGKDEDGENRMGARSGPGVRVGIFALFFRRL